MALITISGYPCSGKTIRANQLKDAFEEQLADPSYNGPVKKIVIVSDDLLNLTREVYDGKESLSTILNCIDRMLRMCRWAEREATARFPLHSNAARPHERHDSDRRWTKLHQRLSLPNVLRRSRAQRSRRHCESSRPVPSVDLRQEHKMENSCSQPVGLRHCHTGTMPRMACATPPGAGVHAFDVSSTRIGQSHVLASNSSLYNATGSTTSFNGSKSRRPWSDGIRHCSPCPGTRNYLSVTSGEPSRLV